MDALIPLLNIVKVAVGLGFVIFLHELGHFVLAKWNGVKVEKFSIGFGKTLLGFRRGETEYVLAAIPLGGFVKMLGEGPEDEANKTSDPRAYPNKSVGARMAIISAGVTMNVLLGLACFVYAYGRGMEEIPAKIGAVKPGSPAYEAGIRPGDEVVAVDGRHDVNFNSMTLKIRLSGADQKVRMELRRTGQDRPVTVEVEPRRDESAEVPRIGVAPARSLELADPPFLAPAGLDTSAKPGVPDVKAGDLLVGLEVEGSPVPVADADDLHRKLAKYRSVPLTYVFERREKAVDGKPGSTRTVRVVVPPHRFVDFGFRLSSEPITTMQPGSPAEKAGFRLGDRIVRVDGNDFDPMRLPDLVSEHAGKPMKFEVERRVAGDAPRSVSLEAVPDDTPPWIELFDGVPQEVPGLGLAYPVRTRIVSIVPGSPAEKAGLHPGDVIDKMTLPPLQSSKKAKPREIEFTDKSPEWPTAFSIVQGEPLQPIELTVHGSPNTVKITPTPVPDWYLPQRGFMYQDMIRRLPPQNVESALRRGFNDTIDNILSIYAMLRSLAQKRVSPKLLGGPIMIARVAYIQAASGLTELIHFLGILSINLAVLNFLPIPPLDGGQMVFLAAEKIRGRPLPDSAVSVGSWVGIFLLLCLMAYVMFQDVTRWITG